MPTLYIIRGHSGSGKSTLGKTLCEHRTFSADDFFTDPETGEYKYDRDKIKQAHQWCYEQTKTCLKCHMDDPHHPWDVAVANTFTRKWEYQPYIDLAQEYGYTPCIILMENDFGNVHNVPEEVVLQQKTRIKQMR